MGHLDVLRFFQKAIKRSGLPIAYSEGFNPHQLLSFAAPLSVGVESGGEYFDMELVSPVDEAEIVGALSSAMVDGMDISAARLLPEKSKNCMASVTAAAYTIHFDDGMGRAFHEFVDGSDRIVITKKTKKSEREIDLKPLIYECSMEAQDADDVYIVLPCGSTENIKPQLLIEAFLSYKDIKDLKYSLYRRELYQGERSNLSSLLEV